MALLGRDVCRIVNRMLLYSKYSCVWRWCYELIAKFHFVLSKKAILLYFHVSDDTGKTRKVYHHKKCLCINVTLWLVRVTIVAVEVQQCVPCVCQQHDGIVCWTKTLLWRICVALNNRTYLTDMRPVGAALTTCGETDKKRSISFFHVRETFPVSNALNRCRYLFCQRNRTTYSVAGK